MYIVNCLHRLVKDFVLSIVTDKNHFNKKIVHKNNDLISLKLSLIFFSLTRRFFHVILTFRERKIGSC